MSDRAAFEALETARLAARERHLEMRCAALVAALWACPLEADIDNGRRLHRNAPCPQCGQSVAHYIVTTIGFWAELRCADHGCRHRWELDTKETT